ncbi:MAG: hypothetical protein DRI61_01320 [Chloroflexi bacterium]|nr:MAG: hypothetical protein DRI61_01320 [Chloroflexota bacterium]
MKKKLLIVLPEKIVKIIDNFIRAGIYSSRQDFIRDAVITVLKQLSRDPFFYRYFDLQGLKEAEKE